MLQTARMEQEVFLDIFYVTNTATIEKISFENICSHFEHWV